jgi:sugar/nucleoside kinase (ribokinase family)
VKDIEKVTGLGNIAIDLQGLSREIERQRVIVSLNNILKNIYRIPTVSAIHLSSDDMQDIAVGGEEDLKKIRPIVEKALTTAYTIGSRGGYIYINNNIYEKLKIKIEGGENQSGWYYVPSYIETDRGDPTGCGDIFTASLVGFLAMGYSILDAAVRASTISGMRVSRGFPVDINSEEINDISSELRRKIRKIRNALY